jgi:TRAP-type C4-dicarboxylate transport system permease small subunit
VNVVTRYANPKDGAALYTSVVRCTTLLARVFNWAAAGFAVAMMLLTCTDVVLRLFRAPITGTYEVVGLLGSAFVSFSLAHTSLERGHIVVDFLFRKLSPSMQRAVDFVTLFLSCALFGLFTWQALRYGSNLRTAGEVSLTLQIPVYPFVFGVALGCGLLCVVLLVKLFGVVLRGTGRGGAV